MLNLAVNGTMRMFNSLDETIVFFSRLDDQLIMTCADFFMPSSVAIPLTTAFLIRLLILHPHMKQRAQTEIDRVVGRSRLPTLSDKNE